MRFSVLGNLEVRSPRGDEVHLPPKIRTVLSLLLIRRGEVVSVQQLIDEVWPFEPPRTAPATIQTYIYQLRKVLDGAWCGEPHGATLSTASSGYVLRVAAEDIDAVAFERRFLAASRSFHSGDYEPAEGALDAAMALWRAEAFADVPRGSLLEAYSTQLEEARTQALELHIDISLKLGRHLEAVRRLKGLAVAQPLNEGVHTKLMHVLNRLGRRDEALTVYLRFRRSLATELGIEPSPAAEEVHRRLLAGDFTTSDRTSVPSAGQGFFVAPAQLPPGTTDFVGREQQLSTLGRLLGRHGDGSRLVTLTGMAGVGKTALAVHHAHTLRRTFADGQFFATLRQAGAKPVDPSVVLGEFLHAIGFRAEQVPATVEARGRLFRSWCADRDVFVLLDDAASEEQVRHLLPAGARCGVLVTSRSPLYGLGGKTVDIEPLPTGDAVTLLGRLVGMPKTEIERRTVREMVSLCENLPLNIRAMGAKAATQGHLPLDKLAARLADRQYRLDEFKCGDLDLRGRLTRSYESLSDRARRILRLLGRYAARLFTADDVAPLLKLDLVQTEMVLEEIFAERLVLAGSSGLDRDHYVLLESTRIFLMEQEGDAATPAEAS
ncbi:AfsR/SARP family transcriptional regulator [Amycolatopsis decaplanina]|uniref:SARP family transcriptional regulator n=1 Tax=Amycolatopsis decaplanina DSM 44594 TaxID=1284240 RepID=M2X961_9PSEU|nr:AfsR/SARP family transcriptional regulator [Amycolatopsis decaplanina]EME57646.1 SARP family transcriptional regulator [Amycolatopsis decaplanina DSM 44594]